MKTATWLILWNRYTWLWSFIVQFPPPPIFSLASMIHWARQIKEVLSSQDAFEMAENSGPLEEIEFWKNRCADLSGITSQLDKPGVKRITRILELAKSSYVAPFLKLSGQIKVSVHGLPDGWVCKSPKLGIATLKLLDLNGNKWWSVYGHVSISYEVCYLLSQIPVMHKKVFSQKIKLGSAHLIYLCHNNGN